MFITLPITYIETFKSFRKGIIKPNEGTILTTGKVRFVQYLLVFRHIWLHEWKTDPGLETERLDIASIVVGSNKSLALESRF